MLKKIITLFSRPAAEKPYIPPRQEYYYQPELPFTPEDKDEFC